MSSYFYSEYFSLIGSLMAVSILYSFVFSIILMICAKGLFFKLGKNMNSAVIPVYNLFVLNEGLRLNPILTILYFVPFINLGFYVYVCYRIGYVFKQDYDYRLGLVFVPYVFYYLISNRKTEQTVFDDQGYEQEKQEVLDDMLLMTDERLREINAEEAEKNPAIDSIFKSRESLMEVAPTYKSREKKLPKPNLDFDAMEGRHKIVFIPTPRRNTPQEDIVKKVETTYIGSSDKINTRHEDEIGIYEIK